jgi:hypothetical protein
MVVILSKWCFGMALDDLDTRCSMQQCLWHIFHFRLHIFGWQAIKAIMARSLGLFSAWNRCNCMDSEVAMYNTGRDVKRCIISQSCASISTII